MSFLTYTLSMNYGFWADTLGIVHAAIVLFVVGGQALILFGWKLKWHWTRNLWFRRIHMATIAVIMLIAALGEWCPLTLWETQLRQLAAQDGYTQGFIATWLARLLYYQAPLWLFALCYALFTAVAAWTYWKHPPQGTHH